MVTPRIYLLMWKSAVLYLLFYSTFCQKLCYSDALDGPCLCTGICLLGIISIFTITNSDNVKYYALAESV